MPWGLCDCGFSFHAGSPASLKSSIARCRSERVQSDGLQLAQGPMQMSTTLFAILSHKDVHHLDRKLTKQLLAMGARKQQILVKWGFCYPHRCHMGRQLRYNEICAFSYRFALMKVVYSELEKQQMCGGGTSYSTVVLMENNTKLCTTWPHLKQTCESVPLTRTVHWVGYIRKWWKPWLKRQSASQLPFSIQGYLRDRRQEQRKVARSSTAMPQKDRLLLFQQGTQGGCSDDVIAELKVMTTVFGPLLVGPRKKYLVRTPGALRFLVAWCPEHALLPLDVCVPGANYKVIDMSRMMVGMSLVKRDMNDVIDAVESPVLKSLIQCFDEAITQLEKHPSECILDVGVRATMELVHLKLGVPLLDDHVCPPLEQGWDECLLLAWVAVAPQLGRKLLQSKLAFGIGATVTLRLRDKSTAAAYLKGCKASVVEHLDNDTVKVQVNDGGKNGTFVKVNKSQMCSSSAGVVSEPVGKRASASDLSRDPKVQKTESQSDALAKKLYGDLSGV